MKCCEVEDSGSALLRFKSGKSAVIEVSWAGFPPPGSREFGVDLQGTEAGLSLFPASIYRIGVQGFETVLLNIPKLPHPENHIHHFVQCALNGKKPLVAIEESIKVQQVLDAINQAAKTGREVRLH